MSDKELYCIVSVAILVIFVILAECFKLWWIVLLALPFIMLIIALIDSLGKDKHDGR